MNIKKAMILTGATAAGLVGASTAASADQITIKSGDTLAGIAQEHGTTTENLAAINAITDPNLIFAGETIETEGEVAPVQQAPVQAAAPVAQPAAQAATPVAPVQTPATPAPASAPAGSGSTYDEFIANGGTAAMWHTIVRPESGGNPNAVSPNGYRGLGQTKEGWGTGTVAQQTQGMVNYATSRYGSVENAISFRQSNGWW
ncbi:LysM peptidoglycan-binding domain-containing protein [Weissella viridescens]|uniref:LysM peptidoglycan-binding domain-containing protein n=1 Tax=Weissella viridescens TaxID=1629 RepID=UPI0017477273|nr:LysM domain-containing protein [Weissella viridescens]QOD85592.1 LysM peptidoglycan-binding domain-containing protein [Weissella viridescens]